MLLEFFRRLFKRKRKFVDSTSKNIDLGSSSIKYCIDGKLGSFISSVRQIDNIEEITDQENIIKVNNVWYAVGESKTPVSAETRKCKKEHIDILVVYSLVREGVQTGQYNINTLLPYNQLQDKKELRQKIKGVYNVQCTNNVQYKYTLDCTNIKVEGQMSYNYIKDKKDNCTAIINVGFYSTDIAIYKQQEQEEPVTIQTGTNILINQYKHKLDAPNTSVLSYRLSCGDKFTSKEEQENKNAIQGVFRGLLNDIKVVLRFIPNTSKIVICGGGAILFGNMIKEELKGKNVLVLKGEKAVYTDVLGLAKHCTNTTVQIKEDVQVETENKNIVQTDVVQKEKSVQKTVQENNDVFATILDRSTNNNESITKLCKEYNVSRSSFYNYKNNLS